MLFLFETPTTTNKRTVRSSLSPMIDRAGQNKRHLLPWPSAEQQGQLCWSRWNTHWRLTLKMREQTLSHEAVHPITGNLNGRPGTWTQEFCPSAPEHQLPLTHAKEHLKEVMDDHGLMSFSLRYFLSVSSEALGRESTCHVSTGDFVVVDTKSQKSRKMDSSLAIADSHCPQPNHTWVC